MHQIHIHVRTNSLSHTIILHIDNSLTLFLHEWTYSLYVWIIFIFLDDMEKMTKHKFFMLPTEMQTKYIILCTAHRMCDIVNNPHTNNTIFSSLIIKRNISLLECIMCKWELIYIELQCVWRLMGMKKKIFYCTIRNCYRVQVH